MKTFFWKRTYHSGNNLQSHTTDKWLQQKLLQSTLEQCKCKDKTTTMLHNYITLVQIPIKEQKFNLWTKFTNYNFNIVWQEDLSHMEYGGDLYPNALRMELFCIAVNHGNKRMNMISQNSLMSGRGKIIKCYDMSTQIYIPDVGRTIFQAHTGIQRNSCYLPLQCPPYRVEIFIQMHYEWSYSASL